MSHALQRNSCLGWEVAVVDALPCSGMTIGSECTPVDLELSAGAKLKLWRVALHMLFIEPKSLGSDLDRHRVPCSCVVIGGGAMCTKVFFSTLPMQTPPDTERGDFADHLGTESSARSSSKM